jgi:hypothetical protein
MPQNSDDGKIIAKSRANVGSVVYVSMISIGLPKTTDGMINIIHTRAEHPPMSIKIAVPVNLFS